MWVGGVEASPAAENGQFVWDNSRTPILGSLWQANQPNDWGSAIGSQDHVEVTLRQSATSGLNDERFDLLQYFLCEADMF